MTQHEREQSLNDMLVLALSKTYFDFPRKDALELVNDHWVVAWELHEAGNDIVTVCKAIIAAEANKA